MASLLRSSPGYPLWEGIKVVKDNEYTGVYFRVFSIQNNVPCFKFYNAFCRTYALEGICLQEVVLCPFLVAYDGISQEIICRWHGPIFWRGCTLCLIRTCNNDVCVFFEGMRMCRTELPWESESDRSVLPLRGWGVLERAWRSTQWSPKPRNDVEQDFL